MNTVVMTLEEKPMMLHIKDITAKRSQLFCSQLERVNDIVQQQRACGV
jgi:hypothetical protein